jgi:hypothetical protein
MRKMTRKRRENQELKNEMHDHISCLRWEFDQGLLHMAVFHDGDSQDKIDLYESQIFLRNFMALKRPSEF